MLLIRDEWTARRANRHPYLWVRTEPGELLEPQAAERLADTFPLDGYVRLDRSERVGDKRYRNYSRPVVDRDSLLDGDLSAEWRSLVADLLDPGYREAVARVLDRPTAAALEVRLVRHEQGDWIEPHTDREDKLFSHILYFNRDWEEEWGGCLEILESSDPAAVAGRVVPRLGASALLAQAPNSWHQVTSVAPSAAATGRRSLLVHGLR